LGGDGDDAAEPCLVTLNRPWEAGDISNISRAVIACSTDQYTVDAFDHQATYQILLNRRVYETRVSDSCHRLWS
jgi:hypothetical protein